MELELCRTSQVSSVSRHGHDAGELLRLQLCMRRAALSTLRAQVPRTGEGLRCLALLPSQQGEPTQWAVLGGHNGVLVFAPLPPTDTPTAKD